jgi:hypothetical protein
VLEELFVLPELPPVRLLSRDERELELPVAELASWLTKSSRLDELLDAAVFVVIPSVVPGRWPVRALSTRAWIRSWWRVRAAVIHELGVLLCVAVLLADVLSVPDELVAFRSEMPRVWAVDTVGRTRSTNATRITRRFIRTPLSCGFVNTVQVDSPVL